MSCVGAYFNSEKCSVWCPGLMNNIRTQHCTLPSFLEVYKTAGTYSLHIDDNLSQIQRETNAFLLIVRHNTEGPPFADWQLHHQMFFFFVGLKNPVNLVLFFKPCLLQPGGAILESVFTITCCIAGYLPALICINKLLIC